TTPSLAIRSMFGVGWPRAAPPPVYAPKSFQPVSSVISMTMFGLFCCCCAGAGKLATVSVATDASIPRQTFLVILISLPPSEDRLTKRAYVRRCDLARPPMRNIEMQICDAAKVDAARRLLQRRYTKAARDLTGSCDVRSGSFTSFPPSWRDRFAPRADIRPM